MFRRSSAAVATSREGPAARAGYNNGLEFVLASRSQIKHGYGSHREQPQNDGTYDELDPFLVVKEPSMMHDIHGQPSYRPDPTGKSLGLEMPPLNAASYSSHFRAHRIGAFCIKSVWGSPSQTLWIHPSFAFSFDHSSARSRITV